MNHIQSRLGERNIKFSDKYLYSLAKDCDKDTAIFLCECPFTGESTGDFYARNESNGDLVVLIVRGKKPITVMYRRKNQDNTCFGLRVDRIKILYNKKGITK